MHAASKSDSQPARKRPRRLTVFMAAFVAGAAAAVGVNQALDVHLAQKRPQVESEPIFVALRSLAQGSPVTVWDVALRDWPKAMLPTTAMRAEDSFAGCVLRHPVREGQPLLKVQLVRDERHSGGVMPDEPAFAAPAPTPTARAAEPDLWTPAPAAPATTTTTVEPVPAPPVAVAAPQPTTSADVAPPPTEPAVDPADVAAVDPPAAVQTATVEPSTRATDVAAPIVAAEPEPVAVSGEPTLADPMPGEPTLADTPPPADIGVESVVAARSVTAAEPEPTPAAAVDPPIVASEPAVASEAEATATAPRKSRDGVVRYLVVPERVALQADAGFAEPQPPAATEAPAPATRPDVRSLPPVRQAAPTNRSRSAQTSQQRPAPQAAQPPARPQQRPQATQPSRQPPRRQAAPPTTRPPTASAPRGLGGMFPNIAAGIDAMTGRKPKPAAGEFDEAVATDDPAAQTR